MQVFSFFIQQHQYLFNFYNQNNDFTESDNAIIYINGFMIIEFLSMHLRFEFNE